MTIDLDPKKPLIEKTDQEIHEERNREGLNPKEIGKRYHRKTQYSRVTAKINVDHEFKRAITVIHRDLMRLMDTSHCRSLTSFESKTIIEYTKLLNSLKKQTDKELNEMDEDDLKKLAHGNNQETS